MTDPRIETWTSAVGEVPKTFTEKVEEATRFLAAELDSDLTRFWQWHLEHAQADLDRANARAEAEREELNNE